MIKVTIYHNEKNECVGFKAYGHAGQNESGQDIVCAAASILMINTVNAIEQFTKDRFSLVSDETDGSMECVLPAGEHPSKEAELLLKTMVQGLTAMEDDEDYTQYIDIIFEEV